MLLYSRESHCIDIIVVLLAYYSLKAIVKIINSKVALISNKYLLHTAQHPCVDSLSVYGILIDLFEVVILANMEGRDERTEINGKTDHAGKRCGICRSCLKKLYCY